MCLVQAAHYSTRGYDAQPFWERCNRARNREPPTSLQHSTPAIALNEKGLAAHDSSLGFALRRLPLDVAGEELGTGDSRIACRARRVTAGGETLHRRIEPRHQRVEHREALP